MKKIILVLSILSILLLTTGVASARHRHGGPRFFFGFTFAPPVFIAPLPYPYYYPYPPPAYYPPGYYYPPSYYEERVWVPGYWEKRGEEWEWVPGYWRYYRY